MPTEMESLLEMLRTGKKPGSPPDFELVKQEWLEAIQQLYSQVETWLKQSIAEGLLKIDRVGIKREEEDLGDYEAEELRISVSDRGVLRLIPNARLIFGGIGRIDAVAGVSKILLLRKRPGEWVISWRRGTEKNEEPLTQDSCAKLIKAMLF